MGAVWLVEQTKAFNRLAVVKEVIDYFDPTDPEARAKASERFESEARTLGSLKHPGIPDLYAYFTERGLNYLVMEYIEGPDLRKGLSREDAATGQIVPGDRIPADDILRYSIQICEVLEYLASLQPPVVHNDIKPGNIIIDRHSGRGVLVDFGTAKARYLQAGGRPDPKRDSIYGTVGYAAPELYHGRSESRSDVYSLAATAYHLLTDDDPRDHPFKYPDLDTLPSALATILRKALAEPVEERPAAGELRQELAKYLAGQTAVLHALTFPGGDAAEDLDSLLSLAVKHWTYAGGILLDGTLARWLQGTLRDAQAAGAAQTVATRWPRDADKALESFIRRLDPAALPPGRMELRSQSVILQGLKPGQRVTRSIEVVNRGKGHLRGEAFSTQSWLRLGSGTFRCPPGRTCAIPIEIDTTNLLPGQPHLAGVTLIPSEGDLEVVSVQVSVAGSSSAGPGLGRSSARVDTEPKQSPTPAIRVHPTRVDLGTAPAQALRTSRQSVTVSNVGSVEARCRVHDAPAWLLVQPETFRVRPGDQRAVSLVGRVAKVPGRRERVRLRIVVEGGRDQSVDVSVRIGRGGLFG
jgi:serine/threonine protein kinase